MYVICVCVCLCMCVYIYNRSLQFFKNCLPKLLYQVSCLLHAVENVACSTYMITNCGSCDIPEVECYACGTYYTMNNDLRGCTGKMKNKINF